VAAVRSLRADAQAEAADAAPLVDPPTAVPGSDTAPCQANSQQHQRQCQWLFGKRPCGHSHFPRAWELCALP